MEKNKKVEKKKLVDNSESWAKNFLSDLETMNGGSKAINKKNTKKVEEENEVFEYVSSKKGKKFNWSDSAEEREDQRRMANILKRRGNDSTYFVGKTRSPS